MVTTCSPTIGQFFYTMIKTSLISNGNRTVWSPIRSVIVQVIIKSDDRAAWVRFIYHEYDYRPNWTTRSLEIRMGWFKQQMWMWLVDLNHNFESDWLIELSDNNLASELVENRSFFKPITIEEIVIFKIKRVTWVQLVSLFYDQRTSSFKKVANAKLCS